MEIIKQFFKPLSDDVWMHALKRSLGCILAVFIAILLRLENPYWACITAFVVVQSDTGTSLKRCFERIGSTILGALCALIYANLFINYPSIALINIFVFVSLMMSLAYRYNSYLFNMSTITFIFVVINIFTDPSIIIKIAFFRSMEISVGIISETIIGLLIFPSHAINKIKIQEAAMLNTYRDFLSFILSHCKKGKEEKVIFEAKHILLRDAIERVVAMRIGAKIERKLPWQSEYHDYEFEKHLTNSKQLMTRYYVDFFDNQYDQAFDFKLLEEIFDKLNQLLVDFQSDKVNIANFELRLRDLLQQVNDKIDDKFYIKSYLLISLKLFLPNLKASQKEPEVDKPHKMQISKYIELVDLRQGIKSATAALSMPVIWIIFNLPGLTQISVSAIVLMRVSQVDASQSAFLRLAGCIVGYLFGLLVLGMNITSFIHYLIIIFLVIFLFSYMFYSNAALSYLPLQAAVCFALTVINSWAYTTNPLIGFERASGVFFGIISTAVVSYFIWPITKYGVLKFQMALALESFAKFASIARKSYASLSDTAIFNLYVTILKVREFYFGDGFEKELYESLRDLCYDMTIISSIATCETFKMTERDAQCLNKITDKIYGLCSGEYALENQQKIALPKSSSKTHLQCLIRYYLRELAEAADRLQNNLQKLEKLVKEKRCSKGLLLKGLSF